MKTKVCIECGGMMGQHFNGCPETPEPTVNNGFWDRHPDDRAARMDAACERGGVSNFFDLSPEERGACYDRE